MAYEVVMSYHLHMPSYFLGTFTEYPKVYCPAGITNALGGVEDSCGYGSFVIQLTLAATSKGCPSTSILYFPCLNTRYPAMHLH